MSLLYEEKIAKRFAKIKPADFDFWSELDSCVKSAIFFDEDGKPIDYLNKDEIKLAIAYVLICYGIYEMKSTVCALLFPQVLERLISRASVELAMSVMEGRFNDDR